MRFITETFKLKDSFKTILKNKEVPLNDLGNLIFKKEYSKNETWAECVIRVIEANMSVYKTHCEHEGLEPELFDMAENMALTMFDLKWIPGGRQIKNYGKKSRNNNESGATNLNNCSAISVSDSITESSLSMYYLLKNQVGVGFDNLWSNKLIGPSNVVESDRTPTVEDIINSVLGSYERGTELTVYKASKNKNILQQNLLNYCNMYFNNYYDNTRFIADVMNCISLYISGTKYRRAAQIYLSEYNKEFLSLKDINNPQILKERGDIMHSSNNSIILNSQEDYKHISGIGKHIIINGEPGIINGMNIKKYGRIGNTHEIIDKIIIDTAEPKINLVNPCGEISLEPFELCNLVSTVPSNCDSIDEWYQICGYATAFATITTLYMTDIKETNQVILKNRKIGVSITGMSELFENYNMPDIIEILDKGYISVRKTNLNIAKHLGIPISKKVTCVKPDGNTSLLVGTSPGIHYPPISGKGIRRIQINKKHPINKTLDKIPEQSLYNEDVNIYSFPIEFKGRSVNDLSIWEQMTHNMIVNKYWADNNVSFTGRYDYDDEVETVLGTFMPFIKGVSLLKKDNEDLKKIYPQLPYESI